MWVVRLLFALVIGAGLLAYLFEPVEKREVKEWARSRGVSLTRETRAVARRYLVRLKRFRRLGLCAGAAPILLLADDTTWPGWLPLAAAGYLVGIVVAELSFLRGSRAQPRSALLVPRELRSYLPKRMVAALWILGSISVSLVPLYLVVPLAANADTWAEPNAGVFVLSGVGALALAACTEAIARWLVRRPQPVLSDDLLSLDDAIRASSVHGIVGSGIALVLVIQSYQWAAIANTDWPVLHAFAIASALGCLCGAVVGCLYYGYRAGRVHRRAGMVPGA